MTLLDVNFLDVKYADNKFWCAVHWLRTKNNGLILDWSQQMLVWFSSSLKLYIDLLLRRQPMLTSVCALVEAGYFLLVIETLEICVGSVANSVSSPSCDLAQSSMFLH